MEKRIGYNKQKSDLWGSLRDGDMEESDIWDDLKERKDSNESKVVIETPDDLSVPGNRNLPSSSYARMVPIRTSSFSSSSNSSIKGVKQQQSAPVTIPDCSIQKKSKKKKKNHPDDSDDDDDDEVYDCQVPPHEFIAQRVAKSQVSSFSVFEGVGRTLKGRDLSKVRDAVLTQTGFLE